MGRAIVRRGVPGVSEDEVAVLALGQSIFEGAGSGLALRVRDAGVLSLTRGRFTGRLLHGLPRG